MRNTSELSNNENQSNESQNNSSEQNNDGSQTVKVHEGGSERTANKNEFSNLKVNRDNVFDYVIAAINQNEGGDASSVTFQQPEFSAQGDGKTTLLNHILKNREGRKIAVIVNDMSEVNIDKDLVAEGGGLSRTDEKLVELSNGCICCTLRDDLLKEVERLVHKGNIDYIVIESTGISEPVPVAQTFSYIDDELDIDLTSICQLDTMVTVVDVNRFTNDINSEDLLVDRD